MSEQLSIGPAERGPASGFGDDTLDDEEHMGPGVGPPAPARVRPAPVPFSAALRTRLTAVAAAVRQVGWSYGMVAAGAVAAFGCVVLTLIAPPIRRTTELQVIVVDAVQLPGGGSGVLTVPGPSTPGQVVVAETVSTEVVPWLLTGSAVLMAGLVLTLLTALAPLRRRLGLVAPAVLVLTCAALAAALLTGDEPLERQVGWFDLVHPVAAAAVVPVIVLAWGLAAAGLVHLATSAVHRWWPTQVLPGWTGLVLVGLVVVPARLEDGMAGSVPQGTSGSALLGVVIAVAIGAAVWPAWAAGRSDARWVVPAGVGIVTVALAAGWALARTAVGSGNPGLEPYLTVGRWAGIGAWCAVALALLLGLLPGQQRKPAAAAGEGSQPDEQTEAEEQGEQRDEPRSEGGPRGIEELVQGPVHRARGDVDRQVQQRDDKPYQRPVPRQPTTRPDPEPFRRPQ